MRSSQICSAVAMALSTLLNPRSSAVGRCHAVNTDVHPGGGGIRTKLPGRRRSGTRQSRRRSRQPRGSRRQRSSVCDMAALMPDNPVA